MVRDCRAFRPSAWGARSCENMSPAGSDAVVPSTVVPRASRRPPLPFKPLGSGTRQKNQLPLQTPTKGGGIPPEAIAFVELDRLKSEMISRESLIKDLEAEIEKSRHHLVKTLQIAEGWKNYGEKKNMEVQLLERSVEDLEVTIFTLENKVLALENKNAMKEILAMPCTEKVRSCSRRHGYGHQNLLAAQDSTEVIDMEIFRFEMEIYEEEYEDASMTLSEKARRCSADEMNASQEILEKARRCSADERVALADILSTRDIHDDILDAQERAIHEKEISVKELEKMQLGPAVVTDLLDSMLEEGRWLDVTKHLDRVFRVHWVEDEMVFPCNPNLGVSSWKLRFAHPELYCLPRRQLALEFASKGDLDVARMHAHDVHAVVTWTKQYSNRWHACHLMGMMLFKGQVLLTSLTEEITGEEIANERMLTCTSIRDYLHAYLPQASGWLQMPEVAIYDDHHQLMERVGPNKFRCLLCHQLRAGRFSNSALLGHLKKCPAVTPWIKARFRFPHVLKWKDHDYRKYREDEW